MDADSPLIGRVERTFWTVWYYLTGTIHRLLRPEPENSVSTNPKPLEESAADSERAKCHDEDEVSGGEVQGEQSLATESPLSSSRPAVAWDLCTTEIDLGPDEEYKQNTEELKESERDEDTREEELTQTGYGESQLLVAENIKADKDDGVNQELNTYSQAPVQTLKYGTNESMISKCQIIANSAIRGDPADNLEETEKTVTPDFQSLEEIPIKVQDQEEDGLDFETGSIEVKQSTLTDLRPKEVVNTHKEEASEQRNWAETEITENVFLLASGNENKSEETLKGDSEEPVDGELQMASNTRVPVAEDQLIAAGLENSMAPRNSSDKSDIGDEKRASPMETGGQEARSEEEKGTKAEVLEPKAEIQTVREDSKEEVDSTAQRCCINEVLLSGETELHTEGGLKDVAKDISVQIKMSKIGDCETESYGEKSDVKSSNVPAEDNLFDQNQENKDSDVERVTSVTVEPERDTEQEVGWESGNIPECVFKGQSVAWQGPKPPTRKVDQVPEYTNEPEPEENTTQRFLEAGRSEEVESAPLPEEVESLPNRGCSSDGLVVRERSAKGQESEEQSESNLDLVGSELQQEREKLHVETLIQEAGPPSVEENRNSLVSSVKTGIDDWEKESDFGSTSEKDLHDGAEDILAGMEEESWDPEEADDAGGRFMETENLDVEETVRLCDAGEQIIQIQDSVAAVSLGPNINKTLSLTENIRATGSLKQSAVTEFQVPTEDEQQYAVTDVEEASDGVVQDAAEVVVGPELRTAKSPETELNNEEQLVESGSGESELGSDTEMSLSTAESGFSDQSLCDFCTHNSDSHLMKSIGAGSIQGMFDMFGNVSEPASIPKVSPRLHDSEGQDTLMRGTDEAGHSDLKHKESVTELCLDSAKNLNKESEETKDDSDEDSGSQEGINAEEKGPSGKTGLKNTEEADVKSLTEGSTLIRVQTSRTEAEAFVITLSESQDESEQTGSDGTRNSDAWSEEGLWPTESQDNTSTDSEKGSLKLQVDTLKCWEDTLDTVSRQDRAEVEDQLTTKSEYQSEVDVSALDFTAQRSRIAVKNPNVRPPKDPRSLILMSSLDPTPDPRLPGKVPLGGLGIGIKLPGLGAGFPVLKKTQQIEKDETRPESNPKEFEAKPEDTSDTPKQAETQHTRKWMPSRPPGFGNPLMSELKTRLNKTTKD